MDYSKEKYWLWMSMIPDIWYDKHAKLIEIFNEPIEVFNAGKNTLEKTGIFKEKEIYNIVSSREKFSFDETAELLERKEINFASIVSEHYPKKLLSYADKPMWLYYKGTLPRDDEKIVGIVGARNCSQYGKTMAEDIAAKLSLYSVSVVSGMARGIDAAAHRGAIMAKGKTYAVLGSGVDICYPRENIDIYMNIIKNGAVMSEYPPGSQPLSARFPLRNRIISMLSDNIAIIEAKKKSGTLITTDYALKYGKEVFALPGRVGDVLSEGCNELIKSGASLLTDGDDMIFSSGLYMEEIKKKKRQKKKLGLEKENEVVYACLDLLPQSIEEIIKKTGMTSQNVYEVMMQMVLDGIVIEPARNHFARKL